MAAMKYETAWFVYDGGLLTEVDGDYFDDEISAIKGGRHADCDMFIVFELVGGGNTQRIRIAFAELKHICPPYPDLS